MRMTSATLRAMIAGVIAAAIALALVIIALRTTIAPPAVEVRLPDAPARDGVVKVYVTGAVSRPGIYPVTAGARYADAIEAAGGPTEDADPLAVNLARRARDEDHIHVPRRGEGPSGPFLQAQQPIDLNTATVPQLESLPGIGPARAQRIVESRTKDGPFTRPDDLVLRRIVPQSSLEALRDLVQVRP
jgi:competence protein ComEA